MAKVGDTVRFLSSTGGGVIARIAGDIAYVNDDGFEVPVLLKECVVVASAAATAAAIASTQLEPAAPKQKNTSAADAFAYRPQPEADDFEETPEGEKLNVEIAFEASDLKQLSKATYDAYIVNDSNYWLMAAFLTRGRDQHGWTTRWAGTVEPGMQIFMCEVLQSDLPDMDRVAVQYMAYKVGREFDLKAVACIEHRLDTTKFFKLHCWQRNPYFDDPVIALPIVRNDVPARQSAVDARALEEAMKQKAREDRRAPKPAQKKQKPDEPLVIDLHIHELVDTTAGLSNADMLNLQVDKFRQTMDENLRHHGRKIIFIHGKGDGVLRQALLKELAHRYKGHDVQDASFREYGFGATQVKIK